MNEQAINDAYSLFSSKGYNGSVEDFKNLIATNPNALNDAYNLFASKGYNGSVDGFSELMGLKKKEPSVSTSQEGAMAQATEDGSLASQESAPVLDFTKLRQEQQAQQFGELPAQPQAEPAMPPSPQLQQQVMGRMAAGEVDFVPAPLSQVYEKVRAGEQLDPIEQVTLDQRKNRLEVERMVENYSNVKGVGAAANAGSQLFLEMLYPSAMPGSERASDYARNMNAAYKISIGIDPEDADKSFSQQKDVQSAAKVFGVEAANALGLSALSGMLMAPAATSLGVTATTPSLARQAAQTVSRNIAQNPASFALMGYAGSNSAYKQVKNDPTKSEAEKVAYSTYAGLKEMATEAGFIGDLRAWNQTLSAAERSLAKQTFRSTVSDYLKTLGKQGVEEGTEEGISWAGDLLWALATGDELPTAREGWEAMALGAVAPGLAVTGQYAPVMADFAAGYLPFTLPKSQDLTKLSELKKRQATIESDLKKEGLSQEERQKLEGMSDGLLNEIESLRASAWESRQNMSDEDFLTLAKIDAEVEGLYQQFEGAKTATMKMSIKDDVANLLEQKRKIENNYAVQEQATDESVLRAEQPEVGLQEVVEGDQEPQVATEEVVQEEVGTVGTLLNERVVYDDPVSGQPVEGDLFVEGQRVVLEAAGGQQFDLGNVDEVLAQPLDGGIVRPAEMAIMPQEDGSFVFNKEGNQKVAKGTQMFNNQPGLQAITRDDAGNVKRVTLYSEDGTETYNLTGQEAEDAAYYIVRGFVETQEGQDAINQLAERNEEARRDLTKPIGVRPVQQVAPQAAAQVRAEAPAGPVVEGAEADVDAQELADLAADMQAATPARRERLERVAERARAAVSRILPDVKIIVHDTQEAYRAATTFEGEATYNNDTKTIHINGTKATPAAVAHEVFHAVFLDKVKTDAKAQAVAKKMVESLKRVLGENSEAYQYLDEFSKDYDANFQNEEKLAEMVAVLSELYSGVNDIGLSPSAVQSVKNAIKKFITDLAKLFNIPMATTLTDADVLAVLNTIAQKAVTGEVITEADVRTIDRVMAEDIESVESFFVNTELETPPAVEVKPRQRVSAQTNEEARESLERKGRKMFPSSTDDALTQDEVRVYFMDEDFNWLKNFSVPYEDVANVFSEMVSDPDFHLFPSITMRGGFMTMDTSKGRAEMEANIKISPRDENTIYIEGIELFDPKLAGEGVGTKLMNRILAAADKFGLTIQLDAYPTRRYQYDQTKGKDFSDRQLDKMADRLVTDFYSKFGFSSLDIRTKELARFMERKPMASASSVQMRERKDSDAAYENWKNGPKSVAQEIGYKYNMNHKGYTPSNIVKQHFKNEVERLSPRLSVKETLTKTGYYMTLDGKFFNPYLKVIGGQDSGPNGLRQRMGQPNENIFDIVTMARQKGYTDKTIEIYLKQEGFAAQDIKDAMAVNSNIDGAQVPQEFGNVTGGMAQGQTLFDEIKAKLTKMAADGASMMDIRIEAQTLLMDSEVYKAQSVEVKAQLRLSLDATIGTKAADRAFRQEFKELRAMLADRKKARRELETIKRTMRGFIRKNLPQGEYSKAEVVALLKAIVDANVDTLPLVMEKVEGYVTGFKVRKLEKQIQKLLDTKTTGMVSGRQVGRVSVELQNQLAELNDKESPVLADDSMSEEAVESLMSDQLAEYNRIMSQTYISEQEAAKAQLLSIAMMYNDAYMMEDTNPNKVETLQSVVENLAAMIATGRAEMRAELDQQRAQYKGMVAEAYSEITGEQLDMSDTEDAKAANEKKIREAKNIEEKKKNFRNRIKGAIGKMSSFVDNYFTRQMDLPLLLSRITSVITESFGGKLQETVDGRLFDARTEFTRRKMEVMKMLEQKQKEIFGKDYKNQMAMNVVPRFSNDIVNDNEAIFVDMTEAEKLRKEYKSANDKRGKAIVARLTDLEIELSPNQDYYLYNQYKDPANRASFSKKFAKEGDYVKAMEIITNRLDPKLKEWADWQVNELFPSLYEAYNEVYKSIYRTNMPWNQFYAGRIYREGKEGDNTFDLLQGSNEYRTSVGGQSTKARIKNQRPIENMDGNSALNSYLEDMEYFRAYAEVMRDMNKLFENPNIEDAINKTAGSNTHRALKDMMGRIATRGVKDSESQVVNGMINNFIVSKLGFNPTIMVKQLTSAIAFSDYIGWGNWSLYMAKAMPNAKSLWKEWYDNSPVLQERYENSNMGEVLEGYNRTAVAKTSPVLLNKKLFGKDVTILDSDVARWQNSLMHLIKVGDKGGVMGGLANYLYYKDEFKAKNPNATEQQAIDYASRKATRQAISTQQDSGITNKDWYQTSGPVFRFLNVFMSSPKALFRKEMYAVMQLYRKISARSTKAGAGSVTDNLRTLITYHVGVPMLFQWVALGLPGVLANWDDEDEESLGRAAILGNLNALFIVGDLLLGIKDFLEDNPWAGEFKTLPIFEQASEIIQDMKAYSKAKTGATKEKHLVKLINHTIELTGVPASSMYRMYNNLSELANSDDGEAILRLLNFSDYVVEEKASEKK